VPPLTDGEVPEEESVSSGDPVDDPVDPDPGPTRDVAPPLPSPAPSPEDVEELRRHPSTIGGMFYLAILAVTCLGLVVAALGPWRAGVRCIAGAVVAAAAVRCFLPARDAGMLAVRARWFDSLLLAATGAMLWYLAAGVPDA